VADALVELAEDLAVVEIRCVDDVSGSAECIGERMASGREPLRMWKSRSSAT